MAVGCFQLYAQTANLAFDHYGTDNGLSNNEVNDIAQDEDGFIWIATRAGLNRFDGRDFVKYFGDGSPGHFPSNDVYRIIRYTNHRMLIGTLKGMAILNTHTGIVQQIMIPAVAELRKYTNRIIDLLTDSSNNIIISTLGGLYVLDSSLHIIFRHDAFSAADLGKKRIEFGFSIYLLKDEKILVPLTDSLCILDLKEKTLKSIDRLADDEWKLLQFGHKIPNILLNLNKNGLSIISNYFDYPDSLHLNAIDFLKYKKIDFQIPLKVKSEIQWKSKIFFLNDSTVSINSSYQNGLILFKFDTLTSNMVYTGNCLSGVQCNRVFIDRDNRTWVSTDDGIFKQSFYKTAFHNTSTPTEGKIQDIDNYVNGFARFHNQLLVTAFSLGILQYDQKGQLVGQLIPANLKKKNQPWNIISYAQDSFLVSTQSGALWLIMDKKTCIPFWRSGMPKVIDSVAITATFIDSHHQLWMGLGAGLGVFMMNTDNQQWKHFLPDPLHNGFPLRYPLNITEDNWGNIWMSSIEGITRWNQSKQQFDTLITRISGLGDISGQWISVIADKVGNLWICPEDFVLIKWNLQSNQTVIFHQPANQGPLRVHQICGPWSSNMWISTNVGLLCFNTITHQFTLLKKAIGLPEENAIEGRIFFDSVSGRIYAGFDNAFSWFYQQGVLKERIISNTYITDVHEIGDSVSKMDLSFVQFSHNNNSISISFTGINYDDGDLNSYAYRLYEGQPTGWVNIGEQKTINFSNLKPGHYTFQAQTLLPHATGYALPATIVFDINPSFYQMWWFYLICISVIAVAIYSLYRYRINQLLKVQDVRNNISSDLHDDIGAKLTNINILTMLTKQNIQSPEVTGNYLSRIASEIETSGQALDDIVWSINSNNDSISEIVARMRRYAADIFETTSIKLQFNSDKQQGNRNMVMEQRRDLFLIYKEVITNIQKHAMATEVEINVKTENKQLNLTISDNGKGFDTSQPTHRNGLKNMYKRIKKWKGDFIIKSSPDHGTTINILLR